MYSRICSIFGSKLENFTNIFVQILAWAFKKMPIANILTLGAQKRVSGLDFFYHVVDVLWMGTKKSGQVAVLVCTLCKSFEKIWNIHTYRLHAPYLAITNFISLMVKKGFFSDNLISSHWTSPFLALERGRLYSEASRAFESIQPNFQWLEHFFFNSRKVLLSIP